MDKSTSYVSKEKYTALANEIRKWEDDLWHTKHQKAQSEETPDCASKKTNIRESLATVTPAHVSSLRLFWESLMIKETVEAGLERPLRQIQVPTPSSKFKASASKKVSNIDEYLATESTGIENPELPPPPTGIDETLAPEADIPSDLPPPPQLSDVEDVHSKSAGFIDLEESPKHEYFGEFVKLEGYCNFGKAHEYLSFTFTVPECPRTAQPLVSHRYYSRPRLGASSGFTRGVLRNWPNSSNLNESPPVEKAKAQLPRQRSVTFEPKPGSAPGDSEAEVEGDVPSVGTSASSAPSSSLRGRSSIFSDPEERYKYVDGGSLGILESAARLANSVDRLSRNSRSQRSSLAAGDKSAASISDTGEVCSIGGASSVSSDDGSGDSDSVNSEPTSARPSIIPAGVLVSPSSSRGRKSSDAQRRISREASALLDFDCPPSPAARKGRPSRSNTEIAAAEAITLRRLERMKDIADLITREKSLIMEVSNQLTELHSSARAVTTGKSTKSGSISGASVSANEASLVDLNLRFLLACQRRQSLLEELGLLHKGSPVLVPPMRGEPLRARLQLHAVRVALKPPTSDGGGGYVVVGVGDRLRTADGGRPVKYHILAVLKCVGEGRIYHTQTVTLMRVADLPPGTVRAAHFIDLLADIDIVPLRPDFVINIEIYCLQTGGSGVGSGGGGASTDRYQPSGLQTPVSRRTNTSILEKSPITSSAKKCGGFNMTSLLLSAKKKKYYVSQPKEEIDLSAAFTMLSSVSFRHHDDLLFGRVPRLRSGAVRGDDANITGGPYTLTAPEGQENGGTVEMPLFLDGLPRSSPLAGPLGLSDIAVRLQSAVLKRGFLVGFRSTSFHQIVVLRLAWTGLFVVRRERRRHVMRNSMSMSSLRWACGGQTIDGLAIIAAVEISRLLTIWDVLSPSFQSTVFDESGGMGVWTRCWCKLSVDQLVFWRYPEDELEAAIASPSAAAAPIGRLDLRRIVAPWAVQAPQKICVRSNTLYMRSLVAVNPKMLFRGATSGDGEQASNQSSVPAVSILLRASSDYKWMEQRHLICADSEAEMECWLKQLNRALGVLQRWMPEHFARLARYDSGLTFTQPVTASIASRLKQW
ncbi:unnamed protein product [Hydatigera taeniaeformis]|uniref:PH domain-containing protein n=1 Tax=Hydatigena taeniaeformis TaxID=6205 RepID=A0A0R3X424_HYDTA|nr:unnamed protein product [Hydatigera taeniaeformis]